MSKIKSNHYFQTRRFFLAPLNQVQCRVIGATIGFALSVLFTNEADNVHLCFFLAQEMYLIFLLG